MTPDLSKFSYHSEVNYLKKDLTVSEPTGESFNTSDSSAIVLSRSHNFSYRPNIEFAADVAADGVLWMNGSRVETNMGSFFISPSTFDNPEVFAWVDDSDLSFGQWYVDFGGFVDRDVPCKWNIYRDFGTQ